MTRRRPRGTHSLSPVPQRLRRTRARRARLGVSRTHKRNNYYARRTVVCYIFSCARAPVNTSRGGRTTTTTTTTVFVRRFPSPVNRHDAHAANEAKFVFTDPSPRSYTSRRVFSNNVYVRTPIIPARAFRAFQNTVFETIVYAHTIGRLSYHRSRGATQLWRFIETLKMSSVLFDRNRYFDIRVRGKTRQRLRIKRH